MVNFAHIKAGNRLTARYCWKEKKIHLPAPEAHLPAPDPVCSCWTVSKAGAGTLWSLVLLCQENKWRDQEVNGRARTNRNLVEPQLFIQLRVHSLLRVHPPGTSIGVDLLISLWTRKQRERVSHKKLDPCRSGEPWVTALLHLLKLFIDLHVLVLFLSKKQIRWEYFGSLCKKSTRTLFHACKHTQIQTSPCSDQLCV